MEVMYERCAGLDVHKKTVVACRLLMTSSGVHEQETRTFGTTTPELLQLLDWLQAGECTQVAMESTGEYWRPIYNILEGNLEVFLVNARHVKAVPGRKTDVKDAEWLADLLRHGLLRASFIPPRSQRELRDLTRERSNLIREHTRVVNRLQKVLEDANLKLSSVATDIMGVSAPAMLKALLDGPTDPVQLADLAKGRLRRKQAELQPAWQGRLRAHHRFLLTQHLTHLDSLDEQIEQFNQEIARQIEAEAMPVPPPPTANVSAVSATALTRRQALERLDTIPGVDQRLAEVIIAERGIDMSHFPSADHWASWAGLAPGNNESAGKHRSSQVPPGKRPLRSGLIQAAWAAVRKKQAYLSALYHRLVPRRGKKRAIVAVAHSILVSAYYILKRQEDYHELGTSYFDERKRESVANRLLKRLEKLGYQVKLEAQPALATAS